jgi:peptidoglycan/LPS O-acetylase OafA/YrhL
VLSVSVLCIHSFAVSYGKQGEIFLYQPPLRGVVTMILPVFFALSGILVSASFVRTQNIIRFLGLRALRLVPALMVEVFLSAMLLGPLFTTMSLGEYFTNAEFWSYFLNILGHIHYLLPGVFRDNPFFEAVNVSLWTVPYELECYLALTALAVAGVVYRPTFLLAAIVLAHVVVFGRDVLRGAPELPTDGALPGRILILCFLVGVAIFVYRDRLTVGSIGTSLALALSFVMLNLPYAPYFVALPICYATAGLGLVDVKKNRLIAGGDYSYGIYLYAFPAQQTFAHLFPSMREWYFNILFALPTTCLLAALSWHVIEKPALRFKRAIAGTQKLPKHHSVANTRTRPAIEVAGGPN